MMIECVECKQILMGGVCVNPMCGAFDMEQSLQTCNKPIDASRWRWNGPTNDEPYSQTWNKVCKLWKPPRKAVQFLCGIRGHEISATEWGWGGGNVDCWCRWCNKFGSLKPETARFMWESFNIWGRFQMFDKDGNDAIGEVKDE